jgi:hypothetical protein
VKAIQRLIVTSAAYRQSSKVTPETFERDPENRLIARGPRYRLPAVVLRDQALAASGLLVEKIGGPPVKPYQPPGIWEEATFGYIKYEQDHGDALYRRGAYVFWRRIVGPTEFFDTASRSVCTVKPQRTNTPLHALTTLNDVTFVEAAARSPSGRWKAAATTVAGQAGRRRVPLRHRPPRRRQGARRARLGLGPVKEPIREGQDAALKLLANGESKRDESSTRGTRSLHRRMPGDPELGRSIEQRVTLNVAWATRPADVRSVGGCPCTINNEPTHQQPPPHHASGAVWQNGHRRRRGGAGVPVQRRPAVGGDEHAVDRALGHRQRRADGLPQLCAHRQTRHLHVPERRASHVDLFDYKPLLKKMHGKELPKEIIGDRRFSTMTGTQKSKPVLSEITNFAQHGQSQAWVSDFLPQTAAIADDLCFIKSMHTGAVNHAPAITFFLTGAEQPGRPSMGSWLTYGLGTTSENLPAFVVMTSRDKEASCGRSSMTSTGAAAFSLAATRA